MRHFLEFERPIAELEGKIDELRRLSDDSGLNIAEEVGRLETRVARLVSQSYAKLTAWQKSIDDPILNNPLNTPSVGGSVDVR